jgi:hypothetical protein
MTRIDALPARSSRLLSRLRLLLLCAVIAPMLSGCAWLCSFCAGTGTTTTAPKQVAAVVLDALSSPPRVVVFPDPIRYRLADGPGTVEWRLPAGAGLRFPSEGAIRFQAKDGGNEEIVNCQPVGRDGLVFQCLDRATRAGTFKYDITVLPPASTNQGRPITTDPGYINEI